MPGNEHLGKIRESKTASEVIHVAEKKFKMNAPAFILEKHCSRWSFRFGGADVVTYSGIRSPRPPGRPDPREIPNSPFAESCLRSSRRRRRRPFLLRHLRRNLGVEPPWVPKTIFSKKLFYFGMFLTRFSFHVLRNRFSTDCSYMCSCHTLHALCKHVQKQNVHCVS